jgi:hypothetical protein
MNAPGNEIEIEANDTQMTAQFTVRVPTNITDDDFEHWNGLKGFIRRKAKQHFEDTYNQDANTVMVRKKKYKRENYDVIVTNDSSGASRNREYYEIPKKEQEA